MNTCGDSGGDPMSSLVGCSMEALIDRFICSSMFEIAFSLKVVRCNNTLNGCIAYLVLRESIVLLQDLLPWPSAAWDHSVQTSGLHATSVAGELGVVRTTFTSMAWS